MYPLGRYNGVLKCYVCNIYRLEGSIIEGYAAEECIEFCTNYIANLRRDWGGEREREREVYVLSVNGVAEYNRAHLVVLHHMSVVDPYIEMHKTVLRRKNPHMGDVWIWREHNKHFALWLNKY